MFKKLPDYAAALECYQGHNQYGFVYIGGSVESPATLSKSPNGDLVVDMGLIPVIVYKANGDIHITVRDNRTPSCTHLEILGMPVARIHTWMTTKTIHVGAVQSGPRATVIPIHPDNLIIRREGDNIMAVNPIKHYVHELNIKKFNYLFRRTLPFRKWYAGCIALDPYIFGKPVSVTVYYGDIRSDSFIQENKDVLFSSQFKPEWAEMGRKMTQYGGLKDPKRAIKVIIKLYKGVLTKVEVDDPTPDTNEWYVT